MGKKFKNKDLAVRLGVSGTLISLVLNNKADRHGIKKETQERVLALARQMGYFSSIAEKLDALPVEEKPGVIGMIVPSLSDHFVVGITPYLQRAFASIGIGFSVVTKDTNDQRFERLASAFRKFFSGIILVGTAGDDLTIRNLRSYDYPFILLENNSRNLRLNKVCSDIVTGSLLITDHIRELGYKNIVILAERQATHNDGAVIDELEHSLHQLPGINQPQILEIDSFNGDSSSDFEKLDILLRPPFRADLIISLQSNPVYSLMAALNKKKLRVPHDIAIISMEEGPGFEYFSSPVTCLRKPYAVMASKVANILWTEIKNSGKSKFKRQVNLAPELIIRNSCGRLIAS